MIDLAPNSRQNSGMEQFNYNELYALYSISRTLAGGEEFRAQFSEVLQILSDQLGMHRGMISVLDFQSGQAWLDVAHEMDVYQDQVSYGPGEGVTGKVAQSGRPMAIADLGQDPLFLDRTGARKQLKRDELSFLCVPIFYQGKVVGVLSVDKLSREVQDLDRELELLSAVADLMGKVVYFRAVEEENRRLRWILAESRRPRTNIIGRSKGVQEVLRMIDQVADISSTVLIQGETGTGKELVAKALHENSSRAEGPFIQINCAAMPESLLESELFGHEKGAFTGATARRKGCFEEAHGGTVFLDEIGELSFLAQAKLLRVLQEKAIQPLGSSRSRTVDVRVLVATNKDLEDEVRRGEFREDLYYRLNVFPIFIPPLRERGSDILMLADYFVVKYSDEFGKNVKRISTAAIDMLLAYHWPGNVRELENCIERAVLLATGDTIETSHLPPSLQMKTEGFTEQPRGKLEVLVDNFERDLLVDALKDARGNQTQAARLLGTTKRVVQYKVAKYGIDTRRFREKA